MLLIMSTNESGSILEEEVDFLSQVESVTPEQGSENVDCPPSGDPRLFKLSYSGNLTLHGCPRKFQLERLTAKINSDKDWRSSLTFQFGHTVGDAIADTVAGKSRNQVMLDMFTGWKMDLLIENEKQKKSFTYALLALHKFWAMQDDGFFEDYEIVYFHGRPAAELSFKINFPNGFTYRGYVDLVVRNKITGQYVILELKTNSGKWINSAQYKNSSQAIGYSVVLDAIAPGETSYTVEYLVWMTQLERWENFSFPKTYMQRALWLRDRIWDNEQISNLIEAESSYGIWPMQGEHCVSFGKECAYMNSCHLQTESQVIGLKKVHLEPELMDRYGKPWDFVFDWEQLYVA